MKRLLVVVVVFLFINGILIGVQKLDHRDEQARLDEISKLLATEQPIIEGLEKDLENLADELDEMQTRLEELEAEISQIELKYPEGIPQNLYPAYVRNVDEFNAALDPFKAKLSLFEAKKADYSNHVDGYNNLIDEADKLSKEIGTTWYLLPRPRAFSG